MARVALFRLSLVTLGFFTIFILATFFLWFLPASSQVNPQTKNENFELTVPSPSIKVFGKAAPGGLVTIKNGNNVVGTVVADSSGNFSYAFSTVAGIHEITTYYDDPVSNRSVINAKSVSVQPQHQAEHEVYLSPTIERATPETVTQGSLIQVRGYTYAGAKVTLNIDFGSKTYMVTADGNGFYDFVINSNELVLGSHSATISSESNSEQSDVSKQINFNINPRTDSPNPSAPDLIVNPDQLPPPIPNTPGDGAIIDSNTVTITGESVPFAQINIFENGTLWGSVFADENGRWSFDYRATFTPVTFSFEACIDGRCSVLSKTITLNFKGLDEVCKPSVKLKKYRFWGLAENETFELEVKSASSDEGIVEIIWNDGTVERFDYEKNTTFIYEKSYRDKGNYNGKLRFYEGRNIEDNTCYAERYFSVHVINNAEGGFFSWLIIILIAMILYLFSRYWNRKNPKPI